MTTTTIVVPWRAGCPHRARALEWTLPQLEQLADQVLLGELDPGDGWCKATAVAAALPEVTGDVLAVVDADVHIDDPQWLQRCVTALVAGFEWAVPHSSIWRWGPEGSARVMAGDHPDRWATPEVVCGATSDPQLVAQPPYSVWLGGGIVVLPTDLYRRVPLDPRYVGFGQEDESWALALRTLAGDPWCGDEDLWHLWHPPQPRRDRRWGSDVSEALYRRYEAAAGHDDAMAALVDEIAALEVTS